MNNLLSAEFSRLWKNKLFWLAMCFMLFGTAFFAWLNFKNAANYAAAGMELFVEDVIFNLFPMIEFVCAFFVSLFLGAEYDYGTVRNKLMVGNTRAQIFLSKLIICMSAMLLMLAAMLIAGGVVGYILVGEFMMSAEELLYVILCCVMIAAADAAIITGITMAMPNRAAAVVVSVLLIFALWFGASYFYGALNEGEMIYEGVTVSMDGVQFGDLIENPNYVDGIQRKIYEFICDALPSGQAMQINNLDFPRIYRWPLLTLAVIILSTALGYPVFRKKDIK